MKTLFALLALIALALLGSRLSRVWVRERSPGRVLVASGLGYLLLGVLLGPLVGDLLDQQVLDNLLPLIGFALGWVGSLIGAQFRWGALTGLPRRLHLAAALYAGSVVVLVGGTFLLLALPLTPLDRLVLVACALPLPVAVYGYAAKLAPDPERGSGMLVIAGLADVLLLVLAVVLPLLELVEVSGVGALRGGLMVLGLGVGAGLTLSLLLGTSELRRDQFLLLLGVITLWAGFATYFGLSPLGTGLLAGLVFVNLGRRSRAWSIATLGLFERPIYMGILLVAGALLRPVDPSTVLAVLTAFLVARTVAVVVAGQLLSRVGRVPVPGRQLVPILLPQGALGLVVLTEARLLYPDWIHPAVTMAVVAGFAFFALASPAAVETLTEQRAHRLRRAKRA